MIETTTSADWYSDLQIPSILRWWDGSKWTTALGAPSEALVVSAPTSPQVPIHAGPPPARIPELIPKPFHHEGIGVGEREIEGEVAQLRQTTAEHAVPERDQLRAELSDLRRQIHTFKYKREELLAAVVPLRAEVTDLRSKHHQELAVLRSEIQALQNQNLLDRELAELRESTEKVRSTQTNYRRFDDS